MDGSLSRRALYSVASLVCLVMLLIEHYTTKVAGTMILDATLCIVMAVFSEIEDVKIKIDKLINREDL